MSRRNKHADIRFLLPSAWGWMESLVDAYAGGECPESILEEAKEILAIGASVGWSPERRIPRALRDAKMVPLADIPLNDTFRLGQS